MNRKYSSLCKRRKCSGTESKAQTPKSSSENNKNTPSCPVKSRSVWFLFVCLYFFLTTTVYALGHRNDALPWLLVDRWPSQRSWAGLLLQPVLVVLSGKRLYEIAESILRDFCLFVFPNLSTLFLLWFWHSCLWRLYLLRDFVNIRGVLCNFARGRRKGFGWGVAISKYAQVW